MPATETAPPDAALLERLSCPFDPAEVKWKPQVVRQNRALAVAYLDARVIEDRLDQVFGVGGWQDHYHVLPNNNVVCTLRAKVGGEWVEKSDVGSQSDQPDEGDRMKSAFSDALKRAAVKFSIGRYIYRVPHQWVDYDAQTRLLKQTPRLPDWAVPPGPREKKGKPAPAPAVANGGAGDTISRDQWEQIKAKLATAGTAQRHFLEHFGLQKPGELPAGRFQEALTLAQLPADRWAAATKKAPPQAAAPGEDPAGARDKVDELTDRVRAMKQAADAKALRDEIDKCRGWIGDDAANDLHARLADRLRDLLGPDRSY